MMDWTDRHCRAFHRILTRHALLYTEMVTTGAVLHGDRQRILGFGETEHPVALQLGGADPADLAQSARIAAEMGYDEINLNVGCPSDRVQSGRFGASLMREPELVGACIAAMKAAVAIPVTVKCRIGVDDQDPETALWSMAENVIAAKTDGIIVHARKAWLEGLSPKQNRDVPPLDYELVYRLKQAHPDTWMAINGGITDLPSAKSHLAHMDGVMLGRAAYQSPWILADVDQQFFDDPRPVAQLKQVVLDFLPYIEAQLAQGLRLSHITRHMLGLFQAVPGARIWRRILTVEGVKEGAGIEVILRALDAVEPSVADEDQALRRQDQPIAVDAPA